MVKPTNRWNAKLQRERISNAIAAQKLRDEKGFTDGQLMDHFGVGEVTLKSWTKLLDSAVVEAEIYKERMKEEKAGI